MPSSRTEPDGERCGCGRSLAEAETTPYASSQGRLAFRRCQCGSEWTERVGNARLGDPVSSDELIEVHELLRHFTGPLSHLIDQAQ